MPTCCEPSGRRPELLIIGYGNELRGDDALGPRAARAAAAWALPGVRAVACPQLTPEWAAAVAEARAVVFVDAAVAGAGQPVEASPLAPAPGAPSLAHTGDPQTLLGLAARLYGRCPPAWGLTIPGVDFEFGERLSPVAERNLAAALDRLRTLCGEHCETPQPT